MNDQINLDDYEVGYNIPAAIGMDEADIQTPCLVLDLDALERNIKKMGQFGPPAWSWTWTPWSGTSRRWASSPRTWACAIGCTARCTSPWT
jgi:2-hydroxychromene-2-carboxylate isomerase